jgi:hypothetical protein
MADDVRVTNMPEPATKEMVAFKLWERLYNVNDDTESQLAFYAKCLEATYRAGKYHTKAFG